MSWPVECLENIAEFINGKAFKPSDWHEDGIKIIRIQNLTDPSKPYNLTKTDVNDKYIVKKGELLVSWSATIDVFVWNGENAALNQHIFRVVPNQDVVDVNYLRHSLKNSLEKMMKYLHGSTMKHINRREFLATTIPLPPLDDQKRIADILDKADEIKHESGKSLILRKEIVQSLFYDMFGDPISNPKNWNVVNLGDLGKWRSGGTPSRNNPEYYSGEIPWFSSGELNDIFVDKTKEKITSKAIENSAAKIIPIGSIMLGMYDTAALKSTITTMPCACNQAIAFSKLDEKIANSVFIYFLIQLGKEHFRRLQRGVRQKNMNLAMIKAIQIPLPPLELQEKFTQYVDFLEKLPNSIELATNNSLSITQELLT